MMQPTEEPGDARIGRISRLRSALPCLPEEVFDEWLKPYTEMLDWPPSTVHDAQRWNGILSGRPLAFWASATWRYEDGALDFDHLSDHAQRVLVRMRDNYVGGIPNEYSEIEDGKQRLKNIIQFTQKHGRIPSVVVLLRDRSTLDVVDGHHRLVAYFLRQHPQFKAALAAGAVPFDLTLQKWIATIPDGHLPILNLLI